MLRRRVVCLIRRRLSLLGISWRRLQPATARKAQNGICVYKIEQAIDSVFFFLGLFAAEKLRYTTQVQKADEAQYDPDTVVEGDMEPVV